MRVYGERDEQEAWTVFEKILIPSDGSGYALEAARYAADIAKRYGSRVDILYVVEIPIALGISPVANRHDEMQRDLAGHGRDALMKTRKVFEQAEVSPNEELVFGSAVPMILRYAQEGSYDLMVIGARGAGTTAIDQILIGSVAEGILHGAPCPILMVRPM